MEKTSYILFKKLFVIVVLWGVFFGELNALSPKFSFSDQNNFIDFSQLNHKNEIDQIIQYWKVEKSDLLKNYFEHLLFRYAVHFSQNYKYILNCLNETDDEQLKSQLVEAIKNEVFHFVLIGRPGAGKGTFGKYLRGIIGSGKISPGNLFRKKIALYDEGEIKDERERKLIKDIKLLVESGGMVSDNITNQFIETFIENNKELFHSGVIFDGYPRTEGQARLLKKKYPEALIIYLDVSREIAEKRVKRRYKCKQCDKGFSEDGANEFKEPLPDNLICSCGGEIKKRKDDSNQVKYEERNKLFDDEILPELSEFYDEDMMTFVRQNDQTTTHYCEEVLYGIGIKVNEKLCTEIEQWQESLNSKKAYFSLKQFSLKLPQESVIQKLKDDVELSLFEDLSDELRNIILDVYFAFPHLEVQKTNVLVAA